MGPAASLPLAGVDILDDPALIIAYHEIHLLFLMLNGCVHCKEGHLAAQAVILYFSFSLKPLSSYQTYSPQRH